MFSFSQNAKRMVIYLSLLLFLFKYCSGSPSFDLADKCLWMGLDGGAEGQRKGRG